jgi:hypothetical protein
MPWWNGILYPSGGDRTLTLMSEADGWGAIRTVCHGCRTVREIIEQVGPHEFEAHTMLIPGDGTIYRRLRTTFDTADAVVEAPCPECSADDPTDWLIPGFVPPA